MTMHDTGMMSAIVEVPLGHSCNCLAGMSQRSGGRIIEKELSVDVGAGSGFVNIFKVDGSVEIMDAYAEITEVTDITNLTNVYWEVYDGTTSDAITADGATLSGAPVNSLLIRDSIKTQPATLIAADQGRVTDADSTKRAHQPFIITSNSSADTYVRIHYTCSAALNIKIKTFGVYFPKNGGSMEVVT